MIVVDYIVANEDRHLNNFGLVREAESLKWLGAAPIFDSGSSFGYDKLVSSFEWIVFEKLKDAGELIRSAFQQPCQQKMM